MNILVTGAWQGYEAHAHLLREMGHEVVFMQQEADSLPCAPDWVEGVIGNGLFLHHPIHLFSRLRYIQLTSAGTDRVDGDYIRNKAITLHTAGNTYAVPMAESTVCGVLELYKGMRGFCGSQQQRQWVKNRSIFELQGKNVLIVGCGHYGRACAERFHAFGCRVTGVDMHVDIAFPAFDAVAHVERLDALLPSADIVVLAVPGTAANTHLINAHRFSLMKGGAVIANVARGNLIDTEALLAALDGGKLLGAVLDVFEQEPLPAESPLWDFPNVILTPHNSFVGDGNQARLGGIICDNLRAV